MTDADFRAMKGGVDLNDDCQFGQSSGLLPGDHHEHRQDAVRPAHGFPALDDVRPVRRALTCAEQFRVMAFAQLTYRESLRDIEVCLSAQDAKLYHMA